MLWLLANLFAVWETVTEVIGAGLLFIVVAFIVQALMPSRQ
jgi:hypothetical protein